MNSADLAHTWHFNGRSYTFTWLGDVDVPLERVYAVAFAPDGQILLVGNGRASDGFWLPGGGIEPGERPLEALARELYEEAGASLHAHRRIGVQQTAVNGPEGGPHITYQAFYWARITLSERYTPLTPQEVTERILLPPERFLQTLNWGESDPKARLLLETALRLERSAAQDDRSPGVR